MINQQAVQTLVEKLDRNLVTLSEAKDWVKQTYGVSLDGRTKTLWIRALAQKVNAK